MAYLDNSATTQPCRAAVEAMVRCMTEGFYNPSSVYRPAVDAFRAVRECRETLLKAVHGDGCDLYFTSGGTESNNLAILGAAAKMRGPRICAVSAVEHPSVREPFERLRAEGWDVRVIGVSEDGALRWDELERALDDGAALVSCMQVNNETGALLDAERLRRTVNGRALIHVDGVQGFMRVPMHMNRMGVDLYSLSGHKIHGPKGIGALAMSDRARPLCIAFGGGQENGLRSGTENVPGIAGLGQAVRAFARLDDPASDMMELKMRLRDGILQAVPDAKVNGPTGGAPHILNVTFPVKGEVLLHALEGAGILCSTGSACASHKKSASHVLTAMGVPDKEIDGALRFSLCPMNTPEEIDETVAQIRKSVEMLRAFKRR